MPLSEEDEFVLCEGKAEKLLELKKVVRLSGDYYVKGSSHQGLHSLYSREQMIFLVFQMDCEIGAELNGEFNDKGKELIPWNADGEELEIEEGLSGADTLKCTKKGEVKSGTGGWTANEMFEMNKDKLVGKSTFDANLSQYSK